MAIDDNIRNDKLQYGINIKAAKISALLSGKIYKYEYSTGEETLPYDHIRMIEEAKFTNSPLGKAFEKRTKTIIEDHGRKQVKVLKILKPDVQERTIKDVIPEVQLHEEIKNKIERAFKK